MNGQGAFNINYSTFGAPLFSTLMSAGFHNTSFVLTMGISYKYLALLVSFRVTCDTGPPVIWPCLKGHVSYSFRTSQDKTSNAESFEGKSVTSCGISECLMVTLFPGFSPTHPYRARGRERPWLGLLMWPQNKINSEGGVLSRTNLCLVYAMIARVRKSKIDMLTL